LLRGKIAEAKENGELALKAASKSGRKYYIAYAQAILGECLLASTKQQDWRRALALGEDTITLARASTIPSAEARGYMVAAKAHDLLSEHEAAYQAARESVGIVERYPKLHEKVEIYLRHALLFQGTEPESARRSLSTALQTIEENASRITDPERRRAFLEAYPNREVLALLEDGRTTGR
jgi:hypothetical protein